MNCQFCTFTLDHFLFGVEISEVQEVLRHQAMTRIPLAAPEIGGLINLRGQLITAIDLRLLFDLPPREDGRPSMNVVLHTDDGSVSLLVDEINDVIEVDERFFEDTPATVHGLDRELIRGIYKLKDRLLLILRTDTILSGEHGEVVASRGTQPAKK